MIKKVEGILISEKSYSESSKIINVITKEYGVIGMIAKGAKRMKSNLRAVTGKLTYGYFHIYYKPGKLSDLISVDLISPLRSIKTDITKISYVSFIVELVEQVLKHEYNSNIYELLINAIMKIEEGYDPLIITNILEIKLLDYLGIKPMIDSCAICGNTSSIIALSSEAGGYLCVNCGTNERRTNEKVIKLVRMFYYVDIAKITKLEINADIKKEIDTFINDYYDKYAGLYLKSKSFLNNLNKISS